MTSETVVASGAPRATLMLASPLDEEFLIRSQSAVGEPRLVALLEGEPPRIVVSSNHDALLPGAPVASVEGTYLLTGKSFFDLASSDLVMMFASFIPTAEVDAVMGSILAEGRKGRAITAAALILVSALIVFWITLHTRRLSRGIEEFTHSVLGSTAAAVAGGDEIHLIETRFRTLTAEVVQARERLKQEAEEKLVLQGKALAAERQEQELKLLQALQVSEENYHAIFNSANDAIFVFDVATGNVLDANLKAEQLLGRPRETIVGRHYAHMHPPEEEQECRAIFEAAVRKASTLSSDVCVLRADGRAVPVEISTSVMERGTWPSRAGDLPGHLGAPPGRGAGARPLPAPLGPPQHRPDHQLEPRPARDARGVRRARPRPDAGGRRRRAAPRALHPDAGIRGGERLPHRRDQALASAARRGDRRCRRARAPQHPHPEPAPQAERPFLRAPLLEGEGFVAYYAVPLIAKGRVQGVLEVLHRTALALDEEQLGFLEALASQAAIAIDNATLFDESAALEHAT